MEILAGALAGEGSLTSIFWPLSENETEEYLDKYGGHKAAAGLSIHKDNIEPFKKAFIELLNE